MRNQFVLISILLSAVMIGTGCGSYRQMQERTEKLAGRVGDYRNRQAERLAKLNREYDDTYKRLMEQLSTLSATQLQQGRDGDAQKIADRLIGHRDDASLRGEFGKAFHDVVSEQRQAIQRADEAVAAVRESYAAAYQEASLDLAKLDKVHQHLQALAKDENDRITADNFIYKSIEVYRQLQKEQEEQKKKAIEQLAAKEAK